MSAPIWNNADDLLAIFAAAERDGGAGAGLLAVARAVRVEALEGALDAAEQNEGKSSQVYEQILFDLEETKS